MNKQARDLPKRLDGIGSWTSTSSSDSKIFASENSACYREHKNVKAKEQLQCTGLKYGRCSS